MMRCTVCGKENGEHTADCTTRGAVLDYDSLPQPAAAPLVSVILFALSCLSLLVPVFFGFAIYHLVRPGDRGIEVLFCVVFMLCWSLLVYVACLIPSRCLYQRHRRHIDGLSRKLSLVSIAAIFAEFLIWIMTG